MSYANMFELTKCLEDSLRYCEDHPDREHSQDFAPLLARAQERLLKARKTSDQRFTTWRLEDRDDRLAWKHLARELAQVQALLTRVNAVGFMDQKVMYWDTPVLVAAVMEMLSYLRDHEEDLDFAAERVERLERQLELAASETRESKAALKEYMRFSQVRSEALVNAVSTIASFRRALRRDLGRDNSEYHSVRWPQMIAPDEPVL